MWVTRTQAPWSKTNNLHSEGQSKGTVNGLVGAQSHVTAMAAMSLAVREPEVKDEETKAGARGGGGGPDAQIHWASAGRPGGRQSRLPPLKYVSSNVC